MELIILEGSDDISHVLLRGSLDSASIRSVDARFLRATAAHDRPAIVDLSELDYITSLGIGMLLGCAKSLHRRGHRLVLVAPIPPVEHVLRTVGIHEVVPIVSSAEEALRVVRGAAAH
jgi:stage II sporulation protein AA (anti-sigma F factor antagonist)